MVVEVKYRENYFGHKTWAQENFEIPEALYLEMIKDPEIRANWLRSLGKPTDSVVIPC